MYFRESNFENIFFENAFYKGGNLKMYFFRNQFFGERNFENIFFEGTKGVMNDRVWGRG